MKPLFYFLIVSIIGFTNANSQNLSLSGRLIGFNDNTRIIINPYRDNMDIDMGNETLLLLKDDKFEFSQHLEKPTKFSLRVRPQSQDNIVEFEQLTFWAENVPMTLTGTKGQVFQSTISGSAIQDQYFEYISLVAKVENEIKQIMDSVKIHPDLAEDVKSKMRVRFRSDMETMEVKKSEFLYSNPNYYCTAPELLWNITFSPNTVEKKKLSELYSKMNLAVQANIYGKQLGAFLEKEKETKMSQSLEVGDYPYNFTLKDTDDHEIKFSSIQKKVILIDFWASGCGPCRLEHKNYVRLYHDFKDKGFEIVSISQDQSKNRVVEAMKKDGMNWISLWDEDKKVSINLYNASEIPTNYLIVDGKIVALTLRGEQLRQKIESVLNLSKN